MNMALPKVLFSAGYPQFGQSQRLAQRVSRPYQEA